ncbi:MAG: hypothetical protein NT141_03835 [candidate division WWE3 bacterium]|nr:hypothetical protein [candidate division WWE3 bacterium]
MKLVERLKTDRKFLLAVICVFLAILLIPYLTLPCLVIWWFYKKSKISKRTKIITTAGFGCIFALLGAWMSISYSKDAEPHLQLLSPALISTVQADKVVIKGTYEPADRKIWINDTEVTASNGSFEYTYPLKMGENKVEVKAGDWKRASVSLVITREISAEEKTRQEATNRKVTEEATKSTVAPTPKPTPSASPTVATPKASPEPTKTLTPVVTHSSIMDQLWTALDDSIKTRKGYDIQYEDIDKRVTVTQTGSTFWDETGTVRGGYSTLVAYGSKAFKISGVDVVKVVIRGEFTDTYGKDSTEDAMRISMAKTEFDKYDWGNLIYQPIYTQMENSTIEYYIHPAILKNVKLKDLYLSPLVS